MNDEDDGYNMEKDPDFLNKRELEWNAPKQAEIEKRREIIRITCAGVSAVSEVLNAPKNFRKPPFQKNLGILFSQAFGEMMELSAELDPETIDYRKARAEAADTMAYLCAFIAECDEQIKAGE